jgi:hypothetical protein
MIPPSQIAEIDEDNRDAVVKAINFAQLMVGVCEVPPGSNRGPEIDAWADEFGSPPGSFWCALAVGKARKEGGLWLPTKDVGSCDEWYLQAEKTGRLLREPVHGAAVLYTNGQTIKTGRYAGRKDAVHIGLILRVKPVIMAIEGNTTIGKYDRNGYVQTLKEVDTKRVLGYVAP